MREWVKLRVSGSVGMGGTQLDLVRKGGHGWLKFLKTWAL